MIRLPQSIDADLERLEVLVDRALRGDLSPAELRAHRVPMGVYEQRESGTFMLRVRCPAGVLLPDELLAAAEVSRRYGSGVVHVTTRQDIQIHRVDLADVSPALQDLRRVGLSTKGGGGNSVRNINACDDAGVCAHELFDVTPYAQAFTERLLDDPESVRLPRKFKVTLSGCGRDCAGGMLSDVGLLARLEEGRPGFAVYAGGGMGSHTRIADLLVPFLPAEEAGDFVEACKRVFSTHGNRRQRQRARLRFLVGDIGPQRFLALVRDELAALEVADRGGLPQPRPTLPAGGVERGGVPSEPFPARPGRGDVESPVEESRDEGTGAAFAAWRRAVVTPQRQPGYFAVRVFLPLGDISADALAGLAALAGRFGDGAVRTTQRQDLVLRFVTEKELRPLHRELAAIDLAAAPVPVARNIVACAGATTCRLGICASRGLATALGDELARARLDLDGAPELGVNISGCPNACGHHPAAAIGLSGAARRVQGRLVPHYVLQLGGRLGDQSIRLAQGQWSVPARAVPRVVVDLLTAFRESPQFPDFDAFVDPGREAARAAISAAMERHDALGRGPEAGVDWGKNEPFSLAGRGPGECGAGVFDLIEVDLLSARDALAAGRLRAAVVLAARSLLITRGHDARDEAEALRLFEDGLVARGLIAPELGELSRRAAEAVAAGPATPLSARAGEVEAFIAAVQHLYDTMDDSLQLGGASAARPVAVAAVAPAAVEIAAREADLRAVVCPLNYVKTRMLLQQLAPGEVLIVLVNEPGGRSVPESVRRGGDEVVAVEPVEGGARVTIRRAGARTDG